MNWVYPAVIVINLFTISVSTWSMISGHRYHKRAMRAFLRDGVNSGKLARYINMPIPDEYLSDPKAMKSSFVKGFIHGYMSTGRRIAREQNA